jgi:hypothetical protein
VSWLAVDDRFHAHRKRLALLDSPHHDSALALWLLALSWCGSQDGERMTGRVPAGFVRTCGVADPSAAAAALVDAGLWVPSPDGGSWTFHGWDDWNGVAGKEYRSKEQARRRQVTRRQRQCSAGNHSKDCPTIDAAGNPWTCPRRVARDARNGASRDTGTGRAGTGRVSTTGTSQPSPREEPKNTEPDSPSHDDNGDPWAVNG